MKAQTLFPIAWTGLIWALHNELHFLRASARTLLNFHILLVINSYQILQEMYSLKGPLKVLVESTCWVGSYFHWGKWSISIRIFFPSVSNSTRNSLLFSPWWDRQADGSAPILDRGELGTSNHDNEDHQASHSVFCEVSYTHIWAWQDEWLFLHASARALLSSTSVVHSSIYMDPSHYFISDLIQVVVNGGRQKARNFGEGTLNVATMYFNTPQNQITTFCYNT